MIGVTLAAYLATKTGIGELPADTRLVQILGVGAVAGIGFTVSIFISDLAFADPDLKAAAKLGIFVASFLASAIGAAVLLLSGRPPAASSPVSAQA